MKTNLSFTHTALLISLYTTQFLGFAFFGEAFIAILRQNGVSLENLGFIYMLGLFWVFRFLWAPFIDTISFKRLGHYRGWIIIFQSLMVLMLSIISMFNLLDYFTLVVSLAILYVFFSASQDIALDALVLKGVSLENRPTANAIKYASSIFGTALGGGAGLILYDYAGWRITLLVLSFATAIALIQVFFYKEPSKQSDENNTKVDFKQYIEFWKPAKRKEWLLFLIIYPVAISSAYGLITPMLVDLKWSLDKIGFLVHILGYGIGVFAAFSTSWLIHKYGKRKILITGAIGQVIGILLLLPLSYGYDNSIMVTFIVGFIFTFYSPSSVVMTTLMMDEASTKNPAAQFAIQHSIMMFSSIFFSGITVSLSGILGYSNIILLVALIGSLAIYKSFKIKGRYL